MSMTTYVSDSELKNYVSVKDKDLNEIFQEVREKISDNYFLEERTFAHKRLFKKPFSRTLNQVFYRYNGMECQVINFCGDGESSINCYMPKSQIYNWMMGMLAGHEHKNRIK